MSLLGLETGHRVDLHVTLFEGERDELDRLCKHHACTRGTLLGALIDRYRDEELGIPPGADHTRKRAKE